MKNTLAEEWEKYLEVRNKETIVREEGSDVRDKAMEFYAKSEEGDYSPANSGKAFSISVVKEMEKSVLLSTRGDVFSSKANLILSESNVRDDMARIEFLESVERAFPGIEITHTSGGYELENGERYRVGMAYR